MNNKTISLIISGKLFVCLVVGLAAMIFAACIPQTGSSPQADAELSGTKWKLVSFSEAGLETPVIEESTITLGFDSDGQAGGSGGCNSYGASYEVRENMLSLGEITHTMMACEAEGVGEQEQGYLQALETAGRFERTEDRLTIWYGDGQSTLNWQKMRSE